MGTACSAADTCMGLSLCFNDYHQSSHIGRTLLKGFNSNLLKVSGFSTNLDTAGC